MSMDSAVHVPFYLTLGSELEVLMDERCVVLAASHGGQLLASPMPRTELGSEDLSHWDEMLCCWVRSS
jgi:hypothetical protein